LGCSGIRWTICKQTAPRFRQITTPTPHHSIFYRPDALPDAKPAVSNHESTTNRSKRRYWLTADRRVVNCMRASSHDASVSTTSSTVDEFCRQHDRSTCRREIFDNSLRQSFGRKYSYFWKYPNFVITQCRIGRRKLSCQKPTRSVNWSRCNTGL